jgi:hypothetical protein
MTCRYVGAEPLGKCPSAQILAEELPSASVSTSAEILPEIFEHEPPQPGEPRLRWPGDPADRDVKTLGSDDLPNNWASVSVTG